MQKKWTLIFLIYADFIDTERRVPKLNKNLLIELNSVLEDMVKCSLEEKAFNIYIIFSSINYEIQTDGELELRNLTFIFKMVRGNAGNKIELVGEVDKKSGGVSPLHHKEKVAEAFRLVKQHARCSNSDVFLCTWDHGSGFGIFKAAAPEPQGLQTWPEICSDPSFFYVSMLIKVAEEHLKKKNISFEYGEEDPSLIIKNRLYSVKDNRVKGKTGRDFIRLLTNKNSRGFFFVDQIGSEKFIRSKADQNIMAFINASTSAEVSSRSAATLNEVLPDGVELEEKGGVEILTNDELSGAIQEGFDTKEGAEPIAILLMMNCFMMNLHTVFSVRECVDHLVAPQGIMSAPGYNYNEIFKYITDNASKPQNLKAIKVAKVCVTTCHNRNARASSKKFRDVIDEDFAEIDEWSIFSVALYERSSYTTFLDLLITQFDELVADLIKSISNSDFKFLFFYANKFSYDFSTGSNSERYHLIDIFQWLLNVDFGSTETRFDPSLKTKMGIITSDIFREFNKNSDEYFSWQGKRYASNTHGTVTVNQQSGLSLFFPDIPVNTITNIPFFDPKTDPLLSKHMKNWNAFIDIVASVASPVSANGALQTVSPLTSHTSAGTIVSRNLPAHGSV